MKILDDNGKVMQKWVWLIAALLFLASLPVIWVYASHGYQGQGIMGCISVCVLVIYALQFPRYFKSAWIYAYVALLSAFYLSVVLFLPNVLPNNAPTSLVLWPFVLVTIGIDAVVMRIFAKIFGE